jgi:YidC/Oxa1 family membrane protein insertase
VLTVLVKAVFFPLANKSYASMSKMKKLQPEMEKLQGALRRGPPAHEPGDDGSSTAARRSTRSAGCLPILVQIPVFFALYKVLFVTIEMRHAPFFGWIRTCRRPTRLTCPSTCFGLFPWDVPLVPALLAHRRSGP